MYPIVYLDGIHFKVRDSGKIVNKCGYTVFGINQSGIKELLGIWLDENEGAKFWEENWNELSTFFVYPECIRRIIYTTNAVESLHRQFRKVTKTTSIFPHDEALTKLLWLAQRDISKKWDKTLRNWGKVIAQLSIMFPDRITL